ncbi:MAG: polyprenyl synthetase family protein, partial [Candidatus ainarchaeum sp.]|nr:polyprenyl synthetase family protein [Candidatus ainarchaeum sp.]
MISKKTGALIKASCELGAILSEKKNYLLPLGKYGMDIGIAFQIQDDILNLVGQEEKYKKEIGGDITEGKRTLMLPYAINSLNKNEGKELKSLLLKKSSKKEDISRAIELFKDSGSIDYAQEQAFNLVNRSKKELNNLPDSEYKEALVELADFVVKRSH